MRPDTTGRVPSIQSSLMRGYPESRRGRFGRSPSALRQAAVRFRAPIDPANRHLVPRQKYRDRCDRRNSAPIAMPTERHHPARKAAYRTNLKAPNARVARFPSRDRTTLRKRPDSEQDAHSQWNSASVLSGKNRIGTRNSCVLRSIPPLSTSGERTLPAGSIHARSLQKSPKGESPPDISGSRSRTPDRARTLHLLESWIR